MSSFRRQESGRRPRPPAEPMPATPPAAGGGQLDPLPGRPQSGGLGASRTRSDLQLLDAVPETTVGSKVSMKGELRFERLLRVDGSFSGVLISKGDLVIGATGVVVGPVEGMREVVCDGKIVGNVSVERLVLRGSAQVHGDISAKRIHVGEGVVLNGRVNVHSAAPRRLDARGDLVPTEEEVEALAKKAEEARNVAGARAAEAAAGGAGTSDGAAESKSDAAPGAVAASGPPGAADADEESEAAGGPPGAAADKAPAAGDEAAAKAAADEGEAKEEAKEASGTGGG